MPARILPQAENAFHDEIVPYISVSCPTYCHSKLNIMVLGKICVNEIQNLRSSLTRSQVQVFDFENSPS